MKIMSGIAVTGLLLAALMLASTDSISQEACNHGPNHNIQVSVGEDGNPVLKYRGGSAEYVHVCRGDRVQWELTGSNREYFVDFFAGAPFEGATRLGSNGNVVRITIGESVDRRAYDYGLNFADEPEMDPSIIVD
jgi:hypothetical protein